jgi:hypothetical protein
VGAAGRGWVLGGAAVLAAGVALAIAHSGDDEAGGASAPARTEAAPRALTADRFGGNLLGAPAVVRVGRDGAVWTILRHGRHTELARLDGRLLRGLPMGGVEPTNLVEGYRRSSPYLAYAAGRSVGSLRPDGTDAGHAAVPGAASDVALDRFGAVWFTDTARSALGIWDGRRVTELQVRARPRPRLGEIVLGGAGSSKLWFLDHRGRVGLADPVGRVVRIFDAAGGRGLGGPSRLTGSFARAAWYTTSTGVGRVSEEGGSKVVVPRLPAAPGALAGGPDGNLWVTARHGPWLFRVSPGGAVARFALDLPPDAELRDLTRDTRRGALWIACARPRALLEVPLPELRSKMR